MNLTIAGLILIVFGVLYLRKPTVYRRGIWLKTSLAVRLLSEAGYNRYMKGLGVVFIVIGTALALWDQAIKLGVIHA
jgi:hypothetical protein